MEHSHNHDESLLMEIMEHFQFLLVSLIVIVVLAVVSSLAEKALEKKLGVKYSGWSAKKIAVTGLLAAVAGVLTTLEIPVSVLIPDFYKLDISDVAALLSGFLMGPVSGVCVEFLKIVIHLLLHGTHSAFVGELGSFVIGCFFVVPASLLYMGKRTKGRLFLCLILGSVLQVLFGSAFNAFYLIPKYAALYGMDIDAIVAMGTAVNPNITSLSGFVLYATVPFYVIKAVIVSLIAGLILKPLIRFYKKV